MRINGDNHNLLKFFSDTRGSSLVELLVSMALLISVLLPAGVFLGYVAHYPKNQEKIYATGIAQTVMEETIYHKLYDRKEESIPLNPGWTLKQTVTPNEGWVHLEVVVFLREKQIVRFSTIRLTDE